MQNQGACLTAGATGGIFSIVKDLVGETAVNRATSGDKIGVRALEPAGRKQCGAGPPHCNLRRFYVDTDAIVDASARRRFANSSYPELREVHCDFCEGVLKLTGRVSSFYLKQMAITLARQIDGVFQVRDELKVPIVIENRPLPRNRL